MVLINFLLEPPVTLWASSDFLENMLLASYHIFSVEPPVAFGFIRLPQKHNASELSYVSSGAACRIRTDDLRFTKPLL